MGMSRKAMDMSKARMADRAGRAMMAPQPQMGMKKGGKVGSSASKRADGIAHKGKTKGKMIAMKKGGKC
jgi:hypothetical protein